MRVYPFDYKIFRFTQLFISCQGAILIYGRNVYLGISFDCFGCDELLNRKFLNAKRR